MTTDPLQDLLQHADLPAPPAGPPPDQLSASVRRTAARRRRRSVIIRTLGIPLVALTLGLALWLTAGWHLSAQQRGGLSSPGRSAAPLHTRIANTSAQSNDTAASIALLRTEIEALRVEIELRTARIARLRRIDRDRRLALQPDPAQKVRDELEKAALIIVYQADRKYNELNLPESAIADYKRAIDLFGQTKWAAIARDRLAKIQADQKGETL